ncbi:MAG: hypothetical protein U0350_41780 [Caldilineaceae bacterium]
MDTKVQQMCPKLGLEQDPATHQSLPTAAHRCMAQTPPMTPSNVHQASCCLTSLFAKCPIYRTQLKAASAAKPTTPQTSGNNPRKSLRFPWQRR